MDTEAFSMGLYFNARLFTPMSFWWSSSYERPLFIPSLTPLKINMAEPQRWTPMLPTMQPD